MSSGCSTRRCESYTDVNIDLMYAQSIDSSHMSLSQYIDIDCVVNFKNESNKSDVVIFVEYGMRHIGNEINAENKVRKLLRSERCFAE